MNPQSKLNPQSKHKIAYSAYARALNLLSRGDKSKAQEEIAKMNKAWNKYNIVIDESKTLEKMEEEIAYLSNKGLIEAVHINKNSKNNFVQEDINQINILPHNNDVKYFLPNFVFNKKSRLSGKGVLDLSKYTDKEIFNSAINLPCSSIEQGSLIINYNNVAFGGYAPNLKLDLSGKLGEIYHADTRLEILRKYISDVFGTKLELEQETPISLTKKIAQLINDNDQVTSPKKIIDFEKVVIKMVQMLLNEVDLTNDYILTVDKRIYGRNYGHIGTTGGLLNSIFSNTDSTISLNLLIKIGTSDCRATNTTLACLLNIGYKALSSTKIAKNLYIKISHGINPERFEKHELGDHNIVLVKDEAGEIFTKDAFFDHFNDLLLRQAINGQISKGSLTQHHTTGGCRLWGVQIPGALPYPSQQCLT